MPAFELVKWYADALDPATGQLIIGYDSALRWRRLRLWFANALYCRPPGPAQGSAAFLRRTGATLSADGTRFTLAQGPLHGTWQAQAVPLREVLLATGHGSVLWECLLPAATVQLCHAGGQLTGLGYVERLTVTLLPWHLPIQTLRWGRFVDPAHYIVWIRWDGPEPRNLLFHNGQRYPDATITDDELRFGPHHLALGPRHELRTGAVGRTVFQAFAWFRRLLPARILRLHETKWLTEGTLRTNGTAVASGYAVHERVEWPQ